MLELRFLGLAERQQEAVAQPHAVRDAPDRVPVPVPLARRRCAVRGRPLPALRTERSSSHPVSQRDSATGRVPTPAADDEAGSGHVNALPASVIASLLLPTLRCWFVIAPSSCAGTPVTCRAVSPKVGLTPPAEVVSAYRPKPGG